MKQFILTIMLLFTATAASAQQKDDENFSKRLFEARLAEVCLRLNINDEQKSKFAAIYEQYCNEMSELKDKPRMHRPMRPDMQRPGNRQGMRQDMQRPGKRQGMRPGMRPEKRAEGKQKDDKRAEEKQKDDKRAEGKPAGDRQHPTDSDRVKSMKERMEKQKKAQEIRLSYADKFATVLTDKQLVKFFEVEKTIQQKMQKRAFGKRQ